MNDRLPPCNAPSDPWLREAIGAYLLGALEPAENDRVAAHLAECASCRAEYGELTELVPLLASVTETEAVNGPVRPEPAVLGRVLETASQHAADTGRVGRARVPWLRRLRSAGSAARSRPRTMRARLAIAVVGLVAAAGAWVGVLASGGQSAAVAGSWSAAASASPYQPGESAITASVQVSAVSWGSRIQLKMDHVPVGYTCTMVVVSTTGQPVVAGNWKASAEESFTIPGSVSLAPDRIAAIQVELPDGSTLLSLNRPS
ncbi:zf-HC2 domain-containing protein [Actinocrinis puniceicyclus]|uniref:Zf-HC2 domain-containing protein n=1 Tax=Actinocrinis puniceicyclus TaxID=977794 RepID=A0A8J7WK21_9ACTN|nr:zf-HC2 domain-containing protein [Actinocrinis puniceicyclus]MBS2962300.1 zf-HC2 domain-containing protein [Actinocrinis puniceicyclus]